MAVKLTNTGPSRGVNVRGRSEVWPSGATWDVPREVAAWLCSRFPGVYVGAPEAQGSSSDVHALLAASAREIAAEVEAGEHDTELAELERAEQAAKARKTVLRAIKARTEELS